MSNDEIDDLKIEDENDESSFVEFDISVAPSDPTLELLAQQIERDDIIIPFYQRKYVWKIEQASRLIESFLMGLPVPQVFLYINNEGQLEVIDGQQRLMSVKYFLEGYFGEPDDRGRRQIFKLKGLSERSEYDGKTFAELTQKDQRKFRNSTIRTINIKQLKPSLRNDSVFHIFERLNTGGTPLKPQEIRNAVYRGKIVQKLADLNDTPGWRKVLGLQKPDKNQKDVELILRLFGLFDAWGNYEKPMLKFLNEVMQDEKEFSSQKAELFAKKFPAAVTLVGKCFTRPFRPRGVLNSAVLEAVMINILENEEITEELLKKNYPILLESTLFLTHITGGTTDTQVLRARIKIARQILLNG